MDYNEKKNVSEKKTVGFTQRHWVSPCRRGLIMLVDVMSRNH